MLYIDGISLNIVKEELKKELTAKKINRIFKNNEFSISLHFGKIELLFSCVPNLPICYISQNKEKPILDIASSLISNLRKHLMNATLVNIEQLGFDRILVFHFAKINELGEVKKYCIYFECMGKSSNLIFCDEEHKIIDSLKKFYISENSNRTLFNGEKYKRPQFIEKINPFSLTEEKFQEIKKQNISFSSKVEGIGKIFEQSINNYDDFLRILNSKNIFNIYFKNDKIKLATLLDITPKDYDVFKSFATYNEMINFYINYEDISTSFSILKNRLLSNIDKKIKKLNRTLNLIEEDIKDSQAMNETKEQADILASILYNIKKGMPSIRAFDFYRNIEIDITLDPLLNPKENLDKMYKKYNKIKRGLDNALRRKKEVKEEISYLESSLIFIENSSNVEALREIEDELVRQKYLNLLHSTKKTKIKKVLKYGIYSFDNSLILYGRNNLENDNLTLKIANKNDYWFHAKNIPSSHIIVKADFLSDKVIKKACEITAYFTRVNVGEKVEVDYTQKKYISKPNGSKPGFVTYSNYKTFVVEKINLNDEL